MPAQGLDEPHDDQDDAVAHGGPVLVGGVVPLLVAADQPRVVDEHVHGPERVDGLAGHPLGPRPGAQVAQDDRGPAPRRRDAVGDVAGAPAVPPVHDHVGPLGGEGAGDRRAGAGAGPGDESALPGQVQIHVQLGFPRDHAPRWFDEVAELARCCGLAIDTSAGTDTRDVKIDRILLGGGVGFAPRWSADRLAAAGAAWKPLAGAPLHRRTSAVHRSAPDTDGDTGGDTSGDADLSAVLDALRRAWPA